MGFLSLHKGVLLLRYPVMWIAGLFFGICASAGVYLALSGMAGVFYAERLFVFSVVLSPFFVSATYNAVKAGDFSLKGYIKGGISGYFSVLLPGVLILAAALILLFLIAMPVAVTGALSGVIFAGAFLLLFLPFLLLVFFYDTAAVFEGKKVFESIKRSFEVSVAKILPVVNFYAVFFMVLFVMFMGFSLLWSGILAEQFEPMLEMTDEEITSFSQDPEAVTGMLGSFGVLVTAVITFFGTLLFSTVMLSYKAVFYRDYLMKTKTAAPFEEGEYDEKGRWYKYS